MTGSSSRAGKAPVGPWTPVVLHKTKKSRRSVAAHAWSNATVASTCRRAYSSGRAWSEQASGEVKHGAYAGRGALDGGRIEQIARIGSAPRSASEPAASAGEPAP